MAKITPLSDVVNLQSESTAVQTINENSDKIEAAFQNTLSRDGSTPNSMGASLDMDSNRILNVGTPTAAGDAVNKDYIDQITGGLTPDLISTIEDLPDLVQEAQDAAAAAAQSAEDAANYVGAAVSAPKWTTGRTITLTGNVTGVSATWDGSTNISFATTIADGAVTGPKLASGAVVANLTYTPLNVAGGTVTGEVINNHNPTTTLNQFAMGFRGIPIKLLTDNWFLILDDCGKMLRYNSATPYTILISPEADVAYPIGFAVMVRNGGTGLVTLQRGTGVTLLKDGSGASANVTMSQWGKALLIYEGLNTWSVGGTGLT